MNTTTITRRRSLLALAATLSAGGLLAGCNAFSSTTPASLAEEPKPVGTFVATTQPIRNFPPSVSYYQNGDTASGSTGIRYVSGLGYESGRTGPAGGYGWTGANNAAGGAGAASGIGAGTALAGSSDTGFASGTAGAGATGTGLSGTTAAPSGAVGVAGANGAGTGNTSIGTGGAAVGTGGTGAAGANQTAAANAAGVNAGVGAGGTGAGSGAIVDRGVPTNAETLNNANDVAAISGSNVTSGAGSATGSPAGTGTIGGTDVTGRTGVDPNGVLISSGGNANTNTVGGVNTSPGSGGTNGGGQSGPSLGQQAQTAGLIATTPAVGSGLFLANAVTSPYTLWEQRGGIVSTGVQVPPTYTAMPALPPTPANSPVNAQDTVRPIRGTIPGVEPVRTPIGANLGGTPATAPVKPAVLTPVLDGQSDAKAFTIAGDVQFPGKYETGTNVTVSQAISGAGIDTAADPAKVRFRLDRPGVDAAEATLADLQNDKVADIVLKPGDTLSIVKARSAVVEPATAPGNTIPPTLNGDGDRGRGR